MSFDYSNTYICIYILSWIIVFLRLKKRVKAFGAAHLIVSSYILWSLLSLLLYNSEFFKEDYGELHFLPYVYLFIMILVSLMPTIQYEKENIQRIQMPSKAFLQWFFVVYGICSIVVLPQSLSTIQSGLYSLLYTDSGEDLYLDTLGGHKAIDYNISFYGLFEMFHKFFSDVAILFFFYYLSLKDKSKNVVIFLTIVILSDILISVSKGGRTSFVMIIFSMSIGYFIFRKFWETKTLKFMNKALVILAILISIPFMALTISRFGYRDYSGGTSGNMLRYAGQASLNFNIYAFDSNGIRNGDRTLNQFKRIIGFDVPNGISATRAKYSSMKIDDSKFITFVGDFVLDFGPVIASLIIVLFSLLITRVTRARSHTITFHKLVAVYFAMCVCMHGGMYLFYYSFESNWKIFAFYLMYIALLLDYNNQKGKYTYLLRIR